MICTNCRGKTCFNHQSPWHDGLTCREFDNPDATTTANDSQKIESPETRSFRNRFSNFLGRGRRNISIGGITRLENDQEYRDRLLAEKLTKEEDDLERKRQKKSAEEVERRNRLVKQGAQEQRQALDRRQAQDRRAQEDEARKRTQAERYRAQEEETRKRRHLEENRQRKRAEEAASESALLTISKLCPRGCGARIQKTEGCDHMKCKLSAICYTFPKRVHNYELRQKLTVFQVVNAAMNSAGYALRTGVRLEIEATIITNLTASIIHQSFEYSRVVSVYNLKSLVHVIRMESAMYTTWSLISRGGTAGYEVARGLLVGVVRGSGDLIASLQVF